MESWQLVIKHKDGTKPLPWGNNEWRFFGRRYQKKGQVMKALHAVRVVFKDLEFSYRKRKESPTK